MRRQIAQKLKITAVVALKAATLCCILTAFTFFLTIDNAYAQRLSPQQFVQDLQQGRLSTQSAANIIQRTTSMNLTEATEFVSNLERLSDIQSAGDLLDNFLQGNITEQIAQELSELTNLGDIQDLMSIDRIIENLNINADLQSLLSGVNLGQLNDTIENIAGILGGPQALQQLATQTGAQMITDTLNDIAPGLVSALGGTQAVANAISTALGGSGVPAASGGSPPPGDDGAHSCCQCQAPIQINHNRIRRHVTNEFESYRHWFVNDMFKEHILPAWQLMTNQLTTAAMQQVSIIGMFFDAKHQLETQRLFQQLTAKAYKDYQPSEGVCTFGTNIRSLASSERKSDLTHKTLAARSMQRQLSTGDGITIGGIKTDKESRIKNFIRNHCDPNDNGNGFDRFCLGTSSTPERRNKDINYARTIEDELTLDIDFSNTATSPDEEDVLALMTNLFAHDIPPTIAQRLLADGNHNPKALAGNFLDLRSIAAKRSVAQNSIHAITAMKANGETGSARYLYRIMQDLGVRRAEIDELIGESPSYFAQMEVLTKYIYQNPKFYADLYDKPVNIERKGAVLQAIGLMQDRDTFDSLMRSEATLATLLETLLQKEHRRVSAKLANIDSDGEEQ